MLVKFKKCVKIKQGEFMNLKDYFQKAIEEHFALGAINFSNMESLQGIVEASMEARSPMIISVSESALKYMGSYCYALAKSAKQIYPHLFLHLDHGKSFEVCKEAVDNGFDSVMIDGSALKYEDNISITKKVCDYAHKKGVFVEGELGQIKGIEDNTSASEHIYTDPALAKDFVMKTKVDSLAIAIGTSHGAYKYSGKQTLRFDILEEIEKALPDFPLVLHGASTVEQSEVQLFNQYGGKLEKANGIPRELIEKAVTKHNIVKINTDTDIRIALTSQVRKVLSENKSEFDPRKYLGAGREEIKKVVLDKIYNLFFSNGKIF